MPDTPTPLTPDETRSLFQTALGIGAPGVNWQPPDPATLAPFFPAYEIEALIARGGMGAVYRARQLSLNRIVALKLLPFDLGVREDFAERFRREAEALARLQHPLIVAVHDFGQADDGHHFMVMEFVEGSDLAARLRASGRFAPDEALRIVRQVCEALQYAHERGVVHRDIKPGNVLLTAAGEVKVSDFGIAQLAQEQAAGGLTPTGALLGTPDYTAPEQLVPHGAVDARADIFSVGVLLYELLTGTLPRGVFRPASSLVRVPRGLDAVLQRALQSEPAHRFGSAIELRAELVKAGAPPRRHAIRWLAAAGVLALAIGATFPLWRPAPTPAPALPAAPPPFINSLGLRFVPAGTAGVLFCTTETRVRDFAAFASAVARGQPAAPGTRIYVNYTGSREAWTLTPATWQAPTFPQTPEHPVVGVNHAEANGFCEWLTQHERASGRIGTEDRYRLPTDAEWSVAAGLAADAHDPADAYPWHGAYPPPATAGNYASEELREDPAFAKLPVIAGRRDAWRFTAPAGSCAANRFGLHDLGGNVTEWMQDHPRGPAIVRGASWWDAAPAALDAGHRDTLERAARSFVVGFRIVLARDQP